MFALPTYAAPKAYDAKYKIFQDGDQVGKARRQLTNIKDNQWRMQTSSRAKLFLVKVTYEQDAIFEWKDNKAKPLSYLQVSDTSLSSKRKVVQSFDWATLKDHGTYKGKPWEIKLSEASHSRLTDIIQFREQLKLSSKPTQSMAFLIHDRGHSKNESFEFEATDPIKTKAGDFMTWRYRKVHSNPKRQSLYWFAPELDFMPVRIQQFSDGEEQANMVLESIQFAE